MMWIYSFSGSPRNAVTVKNIRPTQSENGLNISSVIFLSKSSTRTSGRRTKMLKKGCQKTKLLKSKATIKKAGPKGAGSKKLVPKKPVPKKLLKGGTS